jgi:hypothetical protein
LCRREVRIARRRRGPLLIRTNSTTRASAIRPTSRPPAPLLPELPLLLDAGPLGCVVVDDWLVGPAEALSCGWPAASSPLAKLPTTVRSWRTSGSREFLNAAARRAVAPAPSSQDVEPHTDPPATTTTVPPPSAFRYPESPFERRLVDPWLIDLTTAIQIRPRSTLLICALSTRTS